MIDTAKLTRVVGLHYEPGDGLPQVIFKGSGVVAEDVLRGYYPAGRPQIVRDGDLLEKLFRLPIDSYISPDLFRVVAIVLAHVFAIERKLEDERGMQ